MKKTAFTASIILALCSTAALAVPGPTVSSFADVNAPANEPRLMFLDNNREVVAPAAASVDNISFATRIDLPAGTTSCQFTGMSFSLDSDISSVHRDHITALSMNLSKWNIDAPGDSDRPNIYARDAAGNQIVLPVNIKLTAAVVANPKTIFVTDQPLSLGSPTPFPKMGAVGDRYVFTRTLSFTYTVSGITNTMTVTDQSASVTIVPPVPGVTYPEEGSPIHSGTDACIIIEKTETGYRITAIGLEESWQYRYELVKSTELQTWSPETTAIVSYNPGTGNWTFDIPAGAGDRRFWKFRDIPENT